MTLKNKLLSSSGAAAADLLAIEDVFSTYLYTGNGSTQTITNGIDLAGEGGLVWRKQRTANSWTAWTHHSLSDTERGVNRAIHTSLTRTEDIGGDSFVTEFNSNGFSIGADTSGFGTNKSTETYASWTFRKAPRFFDVVTYTGDGSANRTINHNLRNNVGSLIVKRTDSTSDWFVWHRSLANTELIRLNLTDAKSTGVTAWGSTTPNSNNFTVNSYTNTSGATYVAYLFAHDPLGPSEDGSDGLIACGSYEEVTGANTEVTLGWEPQFVIKKAADTVGDWVIHDNMRGIATGRDDARLRANDSSAENSLSDRIDLTPTGFINKPEFGAGTIIYIAIRRGPMRPPESGTEVFGIDSQTATSGNIGAWSAGFVTDASIKVEQGGIANHDINSRLTGNVTMYTDATNAESASSEVKWDYQEGFGFKTSAFSNHKKLLFRRAPGFFDVVAYTGDGVAGRTVSHNLGVAPEMMWVKRRNNTENWYVYHSGIGATKRLKLNLTDAEQTALFPFNDTAPTASEFTLAASVTGNGSGDTYIAYLFATLPGVSKVGSYTGNGTSQTINCGFTTGARFVLIKRTDSTGDWYVWDTARGIVAANDPHLSLNTSVAEVTTDDSVDPDNSGFIVNQVAATNINVNAASYIFYAIA